MPINIEHAWSLHALLKDMKLVIQSVAHDQAGVQYGLQWKLALLDAKSLHYILVLEVHFSPPNAEEIKQNFSNTTHQQISVTESQHLTLYFIRVLEHHQHCFCTLYSLYMVHPDTLLAGHTAHT